MNTAIIQIMWKEIGIGFIGLYVLRNILDIYMIRTYKKLLRMYRYVDLEILKEKAEKHLKLCDFFAVGPWNKQIYLTYNGLCWLLASISLLEHNERDFLAYLDKVKKENEFEMKSFVLSLYYRSKNDVDQAMHYYNSYVKSKHIDNDIAIIMNYMFGEEDKTQSLDEIAKRFDNPAIIELFKGNGIL